MKKDLLKAYFAAHAAKSKADKELKAAKELIMAEYDKKGNPTMKQGAFLATFEKKVQSILDREALKNEVGLDKFEGFKKAAPYISLKVLEVK